MTTFRIQASASDGDGDWDPRRQGMADSSVVLGAVRDDIRQTLRMGWIDPSLDAVAAPTSKASTTETAALEALLQADDFRRLAAEGRRQHYDPVLISFTCGGG